MDPDVEVMFATPKSRIIDRNSTRVRNSHTFNRKTSSNIDSNIDTIWNKRLKENSKLYNGTKFRLDSIELKDTHAVLNVGITCYKDFIGTNWSPDAETLMSNGLHMHKNKQAFMSDALGVGSLVLSSDNLVPFLRRSLHCGEACGLWDVPGGHPEPKEIIGNLSMTEIDIEKLDAVKITHEIYDSVMMEVIDEVNIPKKNLSDPQLMGICRNTTSAGRPSAEFLIRCSLKSCEIRDLYLQGSQAEAEESTNIQLVPLDEVLNMSVDNEMWKNMAPSSKGCLILAKEFSF